MSKLHAFNMFQHQLGGFTKSFITECGKTLKEEVDKLIEIIKKKDYFYLTTTSSTYEGAKSFLKERINDIGQYQFFLTHTHSEFLEEQRLLALNLAYSRLDQAFTYLPEMSHVVNGFIEQHNECLHDVTNMVGYADVTPALYDEYRSNLVRQLVGLKEKNAAYVELLFKEHVNSTWDVLENFKENYTQIMLQLQNNVQMVQDFVQKAYKELNHLEKAMDKVKCKLTRPVPFETILMLDDIWDEVENLGLGAVKKKHRDRLESWKKNINFIMETLYELSDDVYAAEVVSNAKQVKGIVDVRSIQKKGLSEEEENHIDYLTYHLNSIVSRCYSLLEDKGDIIDNISGLLEIPWLMEETD